VTKTSNLAKGDVTRLSSIMSCHVRHLGFDRTRNSITKTLKTKHEVDQT